MVDSHIHVFDETFPPRPDAAIPAGATLRDYRTAMRRLGTGRAVVVQTKAYGTDNRCLLDAVYQLGSEGRGIAVVSKEVSDAELGALEAGGVRGLRFSLWDRMGAIASFEDLVCLAPRISERGWHAQIHFSAAQIADATRDLVALECPIVVDHMGRLPPSVGAAHPAFDAVAGMARDGRAWVKLSGPYLESRRWETSWDDMDAVARAWIAALPDRLVWGSDWPHVTAPDRPSAATLRRLLDRWCEGDEDLVRRILIETPAALYGFPSTSEQEGKGADDAAPQSGEEAATNTQAISGRKP